MSQMMTTQNLSSYLQARTAKIQSLARVSGDRAEYANGLRSAAIIQASRNPSILKCSPKSIVLALYEASRLGLDLDLSGSAYLVPYGDEARLIIGYKGLIQIAMRSGQLRKVESFVVRENDECKVEQGTNPRIEHRPCVFEDPGKPVAVYAVATFMNDTTQFTFMRWGDVLKVKNTSRASKSGPWVQFEGEMAKKTAIRRLCKLIPFKTLANALSIEECAESNTPTPVAYELDDMAPTVAGMRDYIDEPQESANGAPQLENSEKMSESAAQIAQARARLEAAAPKLDAKPKEQAQPTPKKSTTEKRSNG